METRNLESIAGLLIEDRNESISEAPKRKRNMTTLKLQWLAERVRRVAQIKKAVADGTYCADSNKVARAMLGLDEQRFDSEEPMLENKFK